MLRDLELSSYGFLGFWCFGVVGFYGVWDYAVSESRVFIGVLGFMACRVCGLGLKVCKSFMDVIHSFRV